MTRNQRLREIFLISLTALVCLAGGIMTWLEGRFFPVGLTIPVAIAAYVFCEHLRWFRLGDLGANILGVLALVASAAEFLSEGQEAKLLSGAHLLVYLQWILLFHDKDDAWYWSNVVLTILQISVCAVLTYSIWFGFWLIIYVMLLIWTLAVFWMFMAETQFRQSESVSSDESSANPSGGLVDQGIWNEASKLSGKEGMSGLSSDGVEHAFGFRPSSVTHSIQLDSQEHWISARFLSGVTAMSAAVIVTGGVVFALIPRLWADMGGFGAEFTAASRGAMPGFSNRVQLNDVSANVDNPRTVFKVQMFDAESFFRRDSRTEVNIQDYASELGMAEPLFRGAVLSEYREGVWKPAGNPLKLGEWEQHLATWPLSRENPTGAIDREPGVIQVYDIEPIETNTLFSMGAVRAVSEQRVRRQGAPLDFRFDVLTHEIRYETERDVRGFVYYVLSPRSPSMKSLPHKLQPPISPPDNYLDVPPKLAKLTALAWQVVGREPDAERQSWKNGSSSKFRLSEEETRGRVQKLLNYLRENQEFRYLLGAPIVDPTLDPVEDFVINRKAGHCEYFASALALMLRAVNIPSRVITGFKGGITNSNDQSLTVVQRNAHAWVEAYVDGGWETLDPTPASSEAVQESSQISLWETSRRFISDTWSNYIVNMSFGDQSGVASPLMAMFRSRFGDGSLPTAARWAAEVISNPRLLFSWQGGLLLLCLGGLLLAIRFSLFLLKWIGKKMIVTLSRTADTRNSGVEFYEKFLGIMALRGLRPFPWQTQREFASVSLNQVPLSESRRNGLADLIPRLFYLVRFGAVSLDEPDRGKIETELLALENELKESEHPRKSRHGSEK